MCSMIMIISLHDYIITTQRASCIKCIQILCKLQWLFVNGYGKIVVHNNQLQSTVCIQ